MKTQRFFIKDNYLSTKDNCDFIITKRYYNHAGAKPRGSVIKVVWAACTVGKKRLRALISYKIAANASILPSTKKLMARTALYSPERDPSEEAVEAVRTIDDADGQLDGTQKTDSTEEGMNARHDDSCAEGAPDRAADLSEVGNPYSPHFRYPMLRTVEQKRTVSAAVLDAAFRRRTPRRRSRSPLFTRYESPDPSYRASPPVHLRSESFFERSRNKVDKESCVNNFMDKAEQFFGRVEECLGTIRTDPSSSMELWDPRNKGFFSAIGGFTKNLDDEQLKLFHDEVLQYAFQCGNNLKSRITTTAAVSNTQEHPVEQV